MNELKLVLSFAREKGKENEVFMRILLRMKEKEYGGVIERSQYRIQEGKLIQIPEANSDELTCLETLAYLLPESLDFYQEQAAKRFGKDKGIAILQWTYDLSLNPQPQLSVLSYEQVDF